MTDEITQIKRRAGITENEYQKERVYELHVYNSGNARPFVSEGDRYQLIDQLTEILEDNTGLIDKIEILNKN